MKHTFSEKEMKRRQRLQNKRGVVEITKSKRIPKEGPEREMEALLQLQSRIYLSSQSQTLRSLGGQLALAFDTSCQRERGHKGPPKRPTLPDSSTALTTQLGALQNVSQWLDFGCRRLARIERIERIERLEKGNKEDSRHKTMVQPGLGLWRMCLTMHEDVLVVTSGRTEDVRMCWAMCVMCRRMSRGGQGSVSGFWVQGVQTMGQ